MSMIKEIYADTCYSKEDDNTMIPVLHFYMEIRRPLSTAEINLYYNPKIDEWYGDVLAYGEWYDMDEEEVKEYRTILDKYKNLIYARISITEFLQYCYENKLMNQGYTFISIDDKKYVGIDSDCNDWYCEYFDTLHECLNWLVGIVW